MRLALTSLLFLSLGCATTAPNQESAPHETRPSDAIASHTTSFTRMPGFLPLSWNEKEGRLLLEIPRLDEELIYHVSLASGVGSNPIGLDRGQMGNTHLVRFERVGPTVLMIQRNLRYRAHDGAEGERRAVEESFASSILASFKVVAEQDGRVLVDATDLFLTDAHGVAARLRDTGQGSWAVDRNRSVIHLPRTKAFPDNTEVEAIITLSTSGRPGPLVSSVTATPEIVTVRQHHSFVKLPPPGYQPREHDPRTGLYAVEFYDYASPFAGPLEKRWIARHRLEKTDRSAPVSDVVKPIIYYVDHGTPEPIRSALVDGAAWWNEAFEKAGFRNAFQVRILPPDADPMDIRYNMINWVHRSTRGWSYGAGVTDPRTGEIIKGNVSLGSLRIRQDVLLASGLVAPFEGPYPEVLATLDPSVSPTQLALARIRQLSAHEVGHTLGISHNMAASTYDRASVMDYPAPLIGIRNGNLDFSKAYSTGVGAFDVFAIRYAYSQFAPGTDEKTELRKIVHDGVRSGMLYVSDPHSRDAGSAHPLGSVWDNGSDPIAMLRHEIEVRRIALSRFGVANLRPGQPLSELEPLLLPLYLHHRYQLEAAVKSLGGVMFTYAVREGAPSDIVPQPVREIVSPARQREALSVALETLTPRFLEVSQHILELIPPTADEYGSGIAERFESPTRPLFDPLAAARSSAAITLDALLHPARAARLNRFHAENEANPPLHEITRAINDVVMAAGDSPRHAAIRRAVRDVTIAKLIRVASDASTDAAVAAAYDAALRDLGQRLRTPSRDPIENAERATALRRIEQFLARPMTPATPTEPPPIPPGPPIG